MDDPEDVEGWTICGERPSWMVSPLPKESTGTKALRWCRGALKYVATALVACAIGYGISVVTNSGVLPDIAESLEMTRSPNSGHAQGASAKNTQPGFYTNDKGTYYYNGKHSERYNGATPTDGTVPVFVMKDGQHFERVK